MFRRLAARYDAEPDLAVTLCLNISRSGVDTTQSGDLVDAFAYDFQRLHWPGSRLPPVYFDPRGLTLDAHERAVLHAKCIVIDRSIALVTSANPTPAAYSRNIELGVVIRGGPLPGQIDDHFHTLIATKALAIVTFPTRLERTMPREQI